MLFNAVRGILFLKPLLPQNFAFYSNLEETVFLWIRERENDSGENVHRILLQLKVETQFIVSSALQLESPSITRITRQEQFTQR